MLAMLNSTSSAKRLWIPITIDPSLNKRQTADSIGHERLTQGAYL